MSVVIDNVLLIMYILSFRPRLDQGFHGHIKEAEERVLEEVIKLVEVLHLVVVHLGQNDDLHAKFPVAHQDPLVFVDMDLKSQ